MPSRWQASTSAAKSSGRAEPAGRRVQAGRLIAPGAVERMFADGKKLDMREAEILHIGRKLLGQFAIGQPFIVALAPPRAEMDLVDRDRRAQGVQARRRRARARQFGFVEDDRGGLGPDLGGEGKRIGFHRQMLAVRLDDVELVVVADAGLRNEQLPIADAAHAHRMPPPVPEIEIADDADALGVRRQHHEGDAVDAVERHRVRAELVVDPLMGAFAEQMEIEVGQDRRKAVGVVQLDDIVAEAGAELIFCSSRSAAGRRTARTRGSAPAARVRRVRRSPRHSALRGGTRARSSGRLRREGRDSGTDRCGGPR